MEIPGLGTVTKDTRFDWWLSEMIPLSVLGGRLGRVMVERYDQDPKKEDLHAAIANFLALDPSVLTEASRHVFQYYEDIKSLCHDDIVAIESPSAIWRHVRLGQEPMVARRAYGDKGVYVSLECNCDWEEEHGLQIVFKNGQSVNKVGPYDGHLTNSDAYAEPGLENVIYRRIGI